MSLPMDGKDIYESVGVWFPFNSNLVTGNVDVSDRYRDIFHDLPMEVADRVIAEQRVFLKKLHEILGRKGG